MLPHTHVPFAALTRAIRCVIAKETYYIAKETYYIVKETYYIAKETYSTPPFNTSFATLARGPAAPGLLINLSLSLSLSPGATVLPRQGVQYSTVGPGAA